MKVKQAFQTGDTVEVINDPYGGLLPVGTIAKISDGGAAFVGIRAGKFSCRAWMVVDGKDRPTLKLVEAAR